MMDFWKVILTALSSMVVLFLLAKLMGHKQVAQLDFFDYITGITIGSIAAEFATELEQPWKPLIAMVVYGIVAVSVSVLSNKFLRMRKYANGTPTVLMDGGKLYRSNLKKAKLDLNEFLMLCRQAGYFDLTAIQTAVFEYNGQLTVLPVSTQRPVTPEDLNLNPQPAGLSTQVIMDGQILEENLKKRGLDLTWLQNQLKAQGYHNAKEVFLGVCDNNNQLTLFAGE